MGRCYYEWTQPLQLHRKITKDTGCRSRYIYFHHWRKRIYAACPNVTKIVLFSYLLITPSLTMMQKGFFIFCLQRSRNNHESMVIIYIRYSSDYLSSTKSYDFRRSNGQRIQPHWVCNHIPFIGKWLFFNSRNHHNEKGKFTLSCEVKKGLHCPRISYRIHNHLHCHRSIYKQYGIHTGTFHYQHGRGNSKKTISSGTSMTG